ncbi:LamG domain-containing protein, partial [bacterium]|nr:LamG domain-containing protein [bacterium]
MKILKSVVILGFLLTISAQAETLFYASFDKSLNADIAAGESTPIGANAAVITIFTERTKGGKGVKKPGTKEIGEALDLASKRGKTASISYESGNNIDTRQGSIQMWIKPKFDIDFKPGKDEARIIFYVKMRGGQWRGIGMSFRYWYYQNHPPCQPTIWLSINDGRSHNFYVRLDKIPWEKDKWHHILAEWDSESIRFYIDGILRRFFKFPEDAPYNPTPPEGPIIIGKVRKQTSDFPFLIDEVRIDGRVLTTANKFDPWKLPGIEKRKSGISYVPKIPCVKVATAPNIDGDLSDNIWKNAVKVSGFTALGSTT